MPSHNVAQVSTDELKKPEIIMEYNRTKGVVDYVDRLKVNYHLARTSRRWPLTLFFVLLNIAGINSYIIYQMATHNTTVYRKDFLRSLIMNLVFRYVEQRVADFHLTNCFTRTYIRSFPRGKAPISVSRKQRRPLLPMFSQSEPTNQNAMC